MGDAGLSLTGLAISGTALTAIGSVIGAVVKAKYSKTRIEPQPLEVKSTTRYVTCDECRVLHGALSDRVSRGEAIYEAVLTKLDSIEQHNETRANRIHERLDPICQTVSSTSAMLREHLNDHRSNDE